MLMEFYLPLFAVIPSVLIMCLIKNVTVSKMLASGSTAFSYDLHKITLFTFYRSPHPAEWEILGAGSLEPGHVPRT